MDEVDGTRGGPRPTEHPVDDCRARVVLDIVGNKWSLLVVRRLKDGPRRFTELKQTVDGISQRMLTVTLRNLERDGILTRTVHEVMPPHVSYELTGMGVTLSEATEPLLDWSLAHLSRIDEARAAHDARTARPTAP
ncbi:helix-turn-helix transcriptional regulator [Streptomyces sp. XM4193]|uniref:winged helix-turn-helix transcriptional regulator n=1 Tax=Streptomyces sp. XM4193 TaxID=2929782 RepID=UPI001FF862E2|nr:helix-turn-helix domain-containing protein [Streptomyces sp. XM4193]MCK1797527.1 helix-turn-helix transcriptional regulator [Streptomyces sp. XM4193]